MHRFNCVIAALAVVAFVSPSLAEDISKTGPTAKTERTVLPGGELKHETAGGQTAREIRDSGGDRAGPETRKGEPRWHHARAERVAIFNHRHHHYHHHDVM